MILPVLVLHARFTSHIVVVFVRPVAPPRPLCVGEEEPQLKHDDANVPGVDAPIAPVHSATAPEYV
jgi:hypothetical protein